MFYNQAAETMGREDLEQLQIERLQTTLNRVYRHVAFYKQAFDRHGVNIERIKSVRDLAQLPFTTREDLCASYPYGMFAVPLRDIVRIHATSGTTGRAIAVGYTKNDIQHWSELVARQLVAVGLTDHDFVQIAFNYGQFTGGLGFHYGAERIGASVIPSSSHGNVRDQVTLMKDYQTTALLTLPSYALTIANLAEKMGVAPAELRLKIGLFGAEPWSEGLRRVLEEKLHITAYDTYGLSEVMGPGVAGECPAKNGLHVQEDHFIVEVIHPQTLLPQPDGQEGELVFTTITKEGFPVIRYRTGDLASLSHEPCACGRTFVRMSRVQGRTDDMIVFKGLKLFPLQVEKILMEVEGTTPHYRIVIDQKEGADTMEVQVEVSEDMLFDEVKEMVRLKTGIAQRLEAELGVTAAVSLVEPKSLRTADGGKRKTVEDRRQR
jgi:phenylacetate-CoA ligase